jgi:hypothetical protein
MGQQLFRHYSYVQSYKGDDYQKSPLFKRRPVCQSVLLRPYLPQVCEYVSARSPPAICSSGVTIVAGSWEVKPPKSKAADGEQGRRGGAQGVQKR